MTRGHLAAVRATMREAAACARSQPVASAITILVVAGMVAVVMLTSGRAIANEEHVLDSLDSAGTRAIIVQAEPGAGLSADVLNRLSGMRDVEWAGGFTAAVDATNSAVSGGVRVPLRHLYTADPAALGIPASAAATGQIVWASRGALRLLGLPDAAGAVTSTEGISYGVRGPIDVPAFLAALEPIALIPTALRGSDELSRLVVVTRSPEFVIPVSRVVRSILGAADPSKVSVQTSEQLVKLRSLIGSQLGSFSRELVLAVLALMGAIVSALLFGLVMMRRRDFGRRRALGASRALVVQLLMFQTMLVSVAGIGVGILGSLIALRVGGDALPGIRFTCSLAVTALATTLAASAVPAMLASRREPIRELRVP